MAKAEVPVVVLSKTFPGLKLRLLVDRDMGVLHWEDEQLDDHGDVISRQTFKLGLPHFVHIEEIFEALVEARDLFTPRRRLDLTQFTKPVGLK